MTTSKEHFVGHIIGPNGRPQNVEFISKKRPNITRAERAAGIEWVDSRYEPGNVLRYGTNTTPGTTDMQTAITNAIASNDVIYVPTGIYNIDSTVTVTDGKTIYGDGYGSQITSSVVADNTLTITGSNSTVHSLRITAAGKTYDGPNRIQGNSIYAHGTDVSTRISNVTIRDCLLEEGQSALQADWVDYIKIINNHCTNTNAGFVQLNFWQCLYGLVEGNTCDGGGVMTNNIGLIGATTGTKTANFVVNGNTCIDCIYEAIQVLGEQNTISNNTIVQDGSVITQMGIQIVNRGTLVDVKSNTISGNVITGSSLGIDVRDFDGLSTEGPKNTVITGNVITDCKGQGILVQHESWGTVITGNTIENVDTTYGSGDGINIQSSQVIANNNHIRDCTLNGIKINGTRLDCDVSHNIIESCGGDGIEDLGGTRTRIIGNSVIGNGAWGISTGSGTTTPVIENNTGDTNTSGFMSIAVPVLDDTGTPSVIGGKVFITGGTTTITDFDDGYKGQEITVISGHTVTFDTTGTSLSGSSVDIATVSGDVTRWVLGSNGTTWILVAFVDASVDNSAGA